MIAIIPTYSLITMSETHAMKICEWRYAAPYDTYNWPAWDIVQKQEIEFGDHDIRSSQYRSIIDGNETLIGFVQLFTLLETVRISLFLAPAFCGNGIGGQAIHWAIDEALLSYPNYEIDLEVETWNKRAIACYLRAGFNISDQYELPSRTGQPMKEVFCMVYEPA